MELSVPPTPSPTFISLPSSISSLGRFFLPSSFHLISFYQDKMFSTMPLIFYVRFQVCVCVCVCVCVGVCTQGVWVYGESIPVGQCTHQIITNSIKPQTHHKQYIHTQHTEWEMESWSIYTSRQMATHTLASSPGLREEGEGLVSTACACATISV